VNQSGLPCVVDGFRIVRGLGLGLSLHLRDMEGRSRDAQARSQREMRRSVVFRAAQQMLVE
jgi:hypothetical protein